jgi:hypothetical protein
MKDFPKAWTIFRKYERFSESMKDFPKVWKIFRKYERFSESMNDFPKVWKIFRKYERFSESVNDFPISESMKVYLYFLFHFVKVVRFVKFLELSYIA